jgi:DNA-binding winged helix-turn-helix (wHTH) protein/TolB-like protein
MDSPRFRFGLFEFDSATRELRREGLLVHLQFQPALVLAALIERHGQVVSREDLHQTLWGGETFVDFERGLNFCISQIRAALNDDSTEPTFIRTIPKHGYQFIAPIERIPEPVPPPSEEQTAPSAEQTVAPPPRSNSRALVLSAVAGFLAVLTLAAAAYRFLWLPRQPSSPIVAVSRFDNETGDPAMDRFTDALADNVVEQLTSASQDRYLVIGNAQILRLPRKQRDLNAIASSLHAAYVVLGQVQSNNGQVRVLAHLIRLRDQTHIWVVRTDRPLTDPLALESDVAQAIAAEFSSRISPNLYLPSSLPPSNP